MSFEKADELVKLVGLQRFYVDSVTGVMTETGKLWVDGEIGIAQEHMITNIMRKIIQHYNARIEMKGLVEGLAVICNPEGDDHSMSNLVLEGLLKTRKYRVTIKFNCYTSNVFFDYFWRDILRCWMSRKSP